MSNASAAAAAALLMLADYSSSCCCCSPPSHPPLPPDIEIVRLFLAMTSATKNTLQRHFEFAKD